MKTFERGFVAIVVLIGIYCSTNFGSNAEDESAMGKPRRTRAANATNSTVGCTLNGTWHEAQRNVFFFIDKCNQCRCIDIDVDNNNDKLPKPRIECTHRNCSDPKRKVYNPKRTTVPPANATTSHPQKKGVPAIATTTTTKPTVPTTPESEDYPEDTTTTAPPKKAKGKK